MLAHGQTCDRASRGRQLGDITMVHMVAVPEADEAVAVSPPADVVPTGPPESATSEVTCDVLVPERNCRTVTPAGGVHDAVVFERSAHTDTAHDPAWVVATGVTCAAVVVGSG